MSVNPYKIVEMFESAIADYAGSKYAVAVESCTAAIFLSLQLMKHYGAMEGRVVKIPKFTYPSIPCSIIHSGFNVKFSNNNWKGEYQLGTFDIWDAALRFRRGMYHGGYQCLSFHVKKLLPIGRGGMILCDHEYDYKWLKKARFDGREPVPLRKDNFTMLGWNCYMQPEQAARGLQLLQALGDRELLDLEVSKQGYPDLSKFPIYAT